MNGFVKMILSSLLLFTSMSFAVSAPVASFGAFTHSNKLYVTLLGDCNTASASLSVNGLCNKNRMTENYATECGVELIVATTRMICPTAEVIPKVFVFDIGKEPITNEAEELLITYQSATVRMKINK